MYYAGEPENVTGHTPSAGAQSLRLALVTGGALFGIKSIGAHLKHVIALNADAMKNRTGDGLQLG